MEAKRRQAVLVTWMIVAVELWALGGCVSSLHPLHDKESLQFDRALLGTWSSDDKTLTIEPAGDRAYTVTIQEDGQKSSYVTHLTRLGESSFADLYQEDEVLQTLFEGEYYPLLARVHLICRVQLDGDLLRIAPLDAEWLQEEIASGKTRLPHERTKDGLILTASTGELRQFLSGRSDRFDEAFSEVSLARGCCSITWASSTRLPATRMLTTMYRKHEDVVIHQTEIHSVRKTMEYRSPRFSAYLWER